MHLLTERYEKESFAFFSPCFGNMDGILCGLWPEKQVMVTTGTTRGHIQETGGGDVRRGWRGAVV